MEQFESAWLNCTCSTSQQGSIGFVCEASAPRYRHISRRQFLLMASTTYAGRAATLCHRTALAMFEEYCNQVYYEQLKTEAPPPAASCGEISRHLLSRSLLRWPMSLFLLAQQNHSSKYTGAMIWPSPGFKTTLFFLFFSQDNDSSALTCNKA